MNDLGYRIIDAGHGAVIVMLLFFAGRLLLVRRDGPLKVRYLSGLFLLLSGLQTLVYFLLEEEGIGIRLSETISIWMDLLAAIAGMAVIGVLVRNRHLYGKLTLYTVTALMASQWCCYILCAIWQFADWTSLLYLPVSGLLWCAIGFMIDRAKPAGTVSPELRNETEDPFLTELNSLLLQDRYYCQESVTRDEVCRKLLTNRTTFSKQLTDTTGMTFSEYLREMRLHEAARLLRETDMPVDQVAYEVGLRSASGFHRNFLLSYGMTPRQYRENNVH